MPASTPQKQYLPVILTMLVAVGAMVALKRHMVINTAGSADTAGHLSDKSAALGQSSAAFSEAETDQPTLERSYTIDNPIAKKFAELAAQKHLNGNCKAAVKHYNRAIKNAPDIAFLYSNRAICQQRLNNDEAALSDAQKAIELDPSIYEAYATLSSMAMRLGQYDQALILANQAIELAPTEGLLYVHRAEAELGRGNPEAAIAAYNQALENTETAAWILYSRAIAYQQSGNKKAALEDCERILKMKTKEAKAMRSHANDLKETLLAPDPLLEDGPIIEN